MMKKIFALASTIGFALTHSHDINIHKGGAIYPPVDFPTNSIVEYYEQAIDFQSMTPRDAPNGYTVVSFYDLNSGRIVDQFGQPAVNTYFRDGKNFKFYQTVPGSDEFCADVQDLDKETTDVKHEILFKFHPDGGAVTYLDLTQPSWDEKTFYHTFQNQNDKNTYYYSLDTLKPVWRFDGKKLFKLVSTGHSFTDKDFAPFVCQKSMIE